MSKRNVINDTLVPLHRKTRRYRKISIQNEERLIRMVEEHKGIFNAVIAGDAALARKLTEEHIENAKENMLERMRNHG